MDKPHYPLEPVFRRILSPFESFLQRTTSGGIILIATTLFSLILASLVGFDAMHHFWGQTLAISVADYFHIKLSWHDWINDGLMTLFFLLVGLELKREILVGELTSLRDAALPIFAAMGGMIVPAFIFKMLNPEGEAAMGWGIPMATDIAFAVGILVLLSWRIPKNLIIFLTALAIVDDLGAVLAIALFYTAELNFFAFFTATILFTVLVLFNRAGIRHPLPYILIGLFLWHALLLSGIHATIAGILLAMTIPAKATYSIGLFQRRMTELNAALLTEEENISTPNSALANQQIAAITATMAQISHAAQSPLQRMEHNLSPWVTFLIIPLFALSNAGIDLSVIEWRSALSHQVTLGVTLGLVLGKFSGISLFSFAAIKLGLARLPVGVSYLHLLGAAWLGGIGFTMSLFIGQLAFTNALYIEQAKLGILLGSALSAVIGLSWLFVISMQKK